jgi:hypothetical protein
MKTPRLRKLCWWFTGVYLAWSLLVYFGSLGSEAHSWWPIFLMPVIFPWSWGFEIFSKEFLYAWLAPDPKTAPESVWILMDRISGGYYIVIGTLWFWSLGKLISRVSSRLFPKQEATESASRQ